MCTLTRCLNKDKGIHISLQSIGINALQKVPRDRIRLNPI